MTIMRKEPYRFYKMVSGNGRRETVREEDVIWHDRMKYALCTDTK